MVLAMIISSGGGFFLDSAVERYDKLPPFQPVICGVGGNLVAVSASKISTRLHLHNILGSLPFGVNRLTSPFGVFYNPRGIFAINYWWHKSSKLKLTVLFNDVQIKAQDYV